MASALLALEWDTKIRDTINTSRRETTGACDPQMKLVNRFSASEVRLLRVLWYRGFALLRACHEQDYGSLRDAERCPLYPDSVAKVSKCRETNFR